jgi:16S rRNA U1498 N3-methylase RsmE
VTLGLEQAGDTIVPEIQLYKRFKPFVEDVLPNLISKLLQKWSLPIAFIYTRTMNQTNSFNT